MEIKIYDYVHSDTAISYEVGEKCLKDILAVIDKEKVTIDFDKVNFVITAFLNPIIGDLILQKGEGIIDKVDIVNANGNILQKIAMIKEGALVRREDLDE